MTQPIFVFDEGPCALEEVSGQTMRFCKGGKFLYNNGWLESECRRILHLEVS